MKFNKNTTDCRLEPVVKNDVVEYAVIRYPSAMEVCGEGVDPWLDYKHTRKLANVLNVSEDEVEEIFNGWRAVTPTQWSDMCKVLKDKAFAIMPRVHVSVELNVFADGAGITLDDADLDKRVFKVI